MKIPFVLASLFIVKASLLLHRKLNRTTPSKWNRAYYANALFDFGNRPAAYVITYDEFLQNFVGGQSYACHDYTINGFLFDEGGVYGFPDCIVRFTSQADLSKYRKWCKESGNVLITGKRYNRNKPNILRRKNYEETN